MKKVILSVVLVLALSVIVNNSHAQNFNGAVLKATLLTQFPDPARAGDTVEVRVVLKNIGTEDAKSVVASIILKYPFTPLSGETYERSIDIIPQSPQEASSKTLIFKMGVDKNAIDGKHDLVFSQTIGNSPFGGSNVFYIDVTSKEFAQIVT